MKRILTFLLAIMVVLSICTYSVSAAPSPTPVNYYAMHVGIQGSGHAEVDKTSILAGSDELVTYTAGVGDSPFVRWHFEGEFEIIEGHLTDTVIKIHPTSDILGIAIFEDGEGKEPVTNIDKSTTSPQTGQSSTPVFIVLAILVVSTMLAMISVKNLKRKS